MIQSMHSFVGAPDHRKVEIQCRDGHVQQSDDVGVIVHRQTPERSIKCGDVVIGV